MSRTAPLVVTLIMLITAAATGFASPSAPQSTPDIRKHVTSGKKTIIFFLNPFGLPCKKQGEILTALQKDRKNGFNIAYVGTDKEENRQAFYDYGVRSLPLVVLVDSKGMISKVFPPGIQPYETLAAALDGAK